MMCDNDVSILTGHSQSKRYIIYLRNQEMYVPLIYVGGEVCATFLYTMTYVYFLDILNFIPLDLPPPRLV
jgi:hypothetical protein